MNIFRTVRNPVAASMQRIPCDTNLSRPCGARRIACTGSGPVSLDALRECRVKKTDHPRQEIMKWKSVNEEIGD